jgi:iron(III) transport system substrate-binding protein
MKRSIHLTGVAILALSLALGWSTSAVAQSGNLVYYAAGGSKVNKALVKAFKKKYPNIKAELLNLGGGEALARVRAEKDRPQGDVLFSTVETFIAHPELFASYKAKDHSAYPDWAVGANNKYYGVELALMIFIVNTKEMALAKAPQSWKDLGSSKYKGKIVMANPALSGSAYSQLAQMIQLYGWGLVDKVVGNAIIVPKSRLVYTQVGRGEFPVGLTEESRVYASIKKGFPVKPVYPSEGTAIRLSSIGIIKGGPNPKNAKLFVDFRVSREANIIQTKVRGKRVVRADVKPRKGMPPTSSLKLFKYDAKAAGGMREANLKKFDEIFAKKK